MWRILGINSDNTVRLITDDAVTSLPYSKKGQALTYKTNQGDLNDWLNNYFYNNLNSTKSIIKEGAYFCSETTNGQELTEGRASCTSGNEVTAKVGLISIDEYLMYDVSGPINDGAYLWTMTPYDSEYAFYTDVLGARKVQPNAMLKVRPVINVDGNAKMTGGDGTATNYYVLAEDKDTDKTGTLVENVTSGEYVKLEGKTYRVVSKENDGIKLILDGYYEGTVTYGDDNVFTLASGIGQKLNGDVLTWLGLSDSDKIVETMWYQGDALGTEFKYNNSLNEINGTSAKVGLIRVGEMLSGNSSTMQTKNYTDGYVYDSPYWAMNKFYISPYAYYIGTHGASIDINSSTLYVRPVIKVKNNLNISKGNGTWDNPYEV